MKNLSLWVVLFTSSLLVFGNWPASKDDADSYIQIYQKWIELDQNDGERLTAETRLAEVTYQTYLDMYKKHAVTPMELERKKLNLELIKVEQEKQRLKVEESEARLEVVKARIAAGLIDFPICAQSGNSIPTPVGPTRRADIEGNAYIRLYKKWLERDVMSQQQAVRIEQLRKSEFEKWEKIYAKGSASLYELTTAETAYKVAHIATKRWGIRIVESKARLSLVYSMVAAGVNDIPFCTRPEN